MTNPNEHEQATPTDDTTYNLFTVVGSDQDPILVEVTVVNTTPVQMELNTGASLSLLSKSTYEKIPSLQLQPIDVQLKTYTEVVQILGEAQVTLVVYVVNGNDLT